MLGYPDGTNIMSEKVVVSIEESKGLGSKVADKIINNGALDLLKNAEKIAFKDEMPQRL